MRYCVEFCPSNAEISTNQSQSIFCNYWTSKKLFFRKQRRSNTQQIESAATSNFGTQSRNPAKVIAGGTGKAAAAYAVLTAQGGQTDDGAYRLTALQVAIDGIAQANHERL